MSIDLNKYGSADPFTWNHSRMLNLLSQAGNSTPEENLLLNAFRLIDRRDFLPEEHHHLAYQDKNIPIGYSETATTPYTLARILRLTQPELGQKYLEIGGGSGYLAALLGTLVGETGRVYSLERVQWLWENARENIRKYPHLNSVDILYRDGLEGLLDKAPYHGIIVSFALNHIPADLITQLEIDGRLAIPTTNHQLHLITRTSEDEYTEELVPDFSSYDFGLPKSGKA